MRTRTYRTNIYCKKEQNSFIKTDIIPQNVPQNREYIFNLAYFSFKYAKNTALCIDFLHKCRVLVEATGFEPTTFASRTQRATNCATPRYVASPTRKRIHYNKCFFKSQSFFTLSEKVFSMKLSLHTTACIAACKIFHFGHGNHIIVPFNRMFQTACRHRKFNRELCVITIQ